MAMVWCDLLVCSRKQSGAVMFGAMVLTQQFFFWAPIDMFYFMVIDECAHVGRSGRGASRLVISLSLLVCVFCLVPQ